MWLMELILPGHCGSLLPALHLLLPPVYMEVSVDNVLASLMRVPQRQRTVEGKATDDGSSGTAEMLSAAAAGSNAAAFSTLSTADNVLTWNVIVHTCLITIFHYSDVWNVSVSSPTNYMNITVEEMLKQMLVINSFTADKPYNMNMIGNINNFK